MRQGDPAANPTIAGLIRDIVSTTPDAQVMADLDACVAWAALNGDDAGKLAISGWCRGGRIAWMYAAHNRRVKAGVAWYGTLAGETNPVTPRHPLDIAPGLTVPVLGLYGAKDSSIALASVEKMQAALAKGYSGSQCVLYPDAGHGFFADYRAGYVAQDAEDGFTRALAWFRSHGAA